MRKAPTHKALMYWAKLGYELGHGKSHQKKHCEEWSKMLAAARAPVAACALEMLRS